MRFHSILFDRPEDSVGADEWEEPAFFADLNLDQVLTSMISGREEYNLRPFFYAPLRDPAAVRYRHDILRDLDKDTVFASVGDFAARMRDMRAKLLQAEKLHYTYQKERLFLDAVDLYCGAVRSLAADLTRLDVQSDGLLAFHEHLVKYTKSERFAALLAETQKLHDDLARVRYSIHIKGNRVNVSRYGGEPDYSAEVEQIFAKFKQGAVKDYQVKFANYLDMNQAVSSDRSNSGRWNHGFLKQ